MKFYYPVIVTKEASGQWRAVFPDLQQCEVTGHALNDVLDRARDAAEAWIRVEMEEADPALPPATDPVDLKVAPNQSVYMILLHLRLMEGWEE